MDNEISEYECKLKLFEDYLNKDKMKLPIDRIYGDDDKSKMIYVSRKNQIEESERLELLKGSKALSSLNDKLKSKKKSIDLDFGEEFKSTKAEQPSIMRHRDIHEKHSEAMLKVIQNMKESSTQIGSILNEDLKTADKMNDLMSESLARLHNNNNSLKDYSKKSSKTTWLMWSVIIFTLLLFIGTFVFMKLFSKK